MLQRGPRRVVNGLQVVRGRALYARCAHAYACGVCFSSKRGKHRPSLCRGPLFLCIPRLTRNTKRGRWWSAQTPPPAGAAARVAAEVSVGFVPPVMRAGGLPDQHATHQASVWTAVRSKSAPWRGPEGMHGMRHRFTSRCTFRRAVDSPPRHIRLHQATERCPAARDKSSPGRRRPRLWRLGCAGPHHSRPAQPVAIKHDAQSGRLVRRAAAGHTAGGGTHCGPGTAQPTATQPTATQPIATQPTATQPTATQPSHSAALEVRGSSSRTGTMH